MNLLLARSQLKDKKIYYHYEKAYDGGDLIWLAWRKSNMIF
jgi:hypothetical protein